MDSKYLVSLAFTLTVRLKINTFAHSKDLTWYQRGVASSRGALTGAAASKPPRTAHTHLNMCICARERAPECFSITQLLPNSVQITMNIIFTVEDYIVRFLLSISMN